MATSFSLLYLLRSNIFREPLKKTPGISDLVRNSKTPPIEVSDLILIDKIFVVVLFGNQNKGFRLGETPPPFWNKSKIPGFFLRVP